MSFQKPGMLFVLNRLWTLNHHFPITGARRKHVRHRFKNIVFWGFQSLLFRTANLNCVLFLLLVEINYVLYLFIGKSQVSNSIITPLDVSLWRLPEYGEIPENHMPLLPDWIRQQRKRGHRNPASGAEKNYGVGSNKADYEEIGCGCLSTAHPGIRQI